MVMHNFLFRAVFIIVSAVLLSSCIMEDRYACPSYLTIDMSDVNREMEWGQIWFFDPFGKLLYKDTISRSMFDNPYVVQIAREDYAKCYVWGNIGKNTLLSEEYSLNTNLTMLDNLPADSLYFYSCNINTNAEFSNIKLRANKEFATVNIIFPGYCDTTAYNVNISIECKNRGFFLDKSFIEKSVTTKAELCRLGLDYSMFSSRILRQGDARDIKMILQVEEKQKGKNSDIKAILAPVPIGTFLYENGYDMLQEDLSDITIKIDLAGNFLYLQVEDWENEKRFDINF